MSTVTPSRARCFFQRSGGTSPLLLAAWRSWCAPSAPARALRNIARSAPGCWLHQFDVICIAMMQTKPPLPPSFDTSAPRVRVTVSMPVAVHETFKRMAAAGGMSTSRTIGDWLADTSDAAEFLAEKMEQARAAPRLIAQEMHAYALGLADETGAVLASVREKSRQNRAIPPSCNTGGKVPKGKGKQGGGSHAN